MISCRAGGWNFKIRAPADLVSSEGLLSGALIVPLIVCPHMVEEERELSGHFDKDTNPIPKAPPKDFAS